MLIDWVYIFTFGQILLLVMLLNDPGGVDRLLDLFIWFIIIPLMAFSPVWIWDGIRPAKSTRWRRYCWVNAGLGLPTAVIILLLCRSQSAPLQLLLATFGTFILMLVLIRFRRVLVKHNKVSLVLITLVMLVTVNTLIWVGSRIFSPKTERPGVLLFGADGADWQITDQLTQAGQLPNIQKGLEDGCRADLQGDEPLFSPILWTTMAAGRPAAEHGLVGRISDLNASSLRCRRVWDIAEQFDKTSGAIQYLGLWPLGSAPSQFALPSLFVGGRRVAPKVTNL